MAPVDNYGGSTMPVRVITSGRELDTLEQELFQVIPLDREPLSAFPLRFSVVLALHNAMAAQQR